MYITRYQYQIKKNKGSIAGLTRANKDTHTHTKKKHRLRAFTFTYPLLFRLLSVDPSLACLLSYLLGRFYYVIRLIAS